MKHEQIPQHELETIVMRLSNSDYESQVIFLKLYTQAKQKEAILDRKNQKTQLADLLDSFVIILGATIHILEKIAYLCTPYNSKKDN